MIWLNNWSLTRREKSFKSSGFIKTSLVFVQLVNGLRPPNPGFAGWTAANSATDKTISPAIVFTPTGNFFVRDSL
jgi:hypothetical protein